MQFTQHLPNGVNLFLKNCHIFGHTTNFDLQLFYFLTIFKCFFLPLSPVSLPRGAEVVEFCSQCCAFAGSSPKSAKQTDSCFKRVNDGIQDNFGA